MPTPDQVRYAAKLKAVLRRYVNQEDEAIKQAISMLKDLRGKIAVELSEVGGFEAYRLKHLQAALEQLTSQFEMQLAASTRATFQAIHATGAAAAIEPLAVLGINAFYAPNQAVVNAVMDYSADLIKNITDEIRTGINTQIRLAVLGNKTPFDTMQAITDILGVEARAGVWGLRKRPEVVKGVAARAEADLRTEMTRVFNLAEHGQQLATTQMVPGLLKGWMATADTRTRPSHLAAHERYMTDPIPVNEPFEIGGEDLMYPGDPTASPENTVNCRCKSVTVHPDVGVIETPLDTAVQEEIERRKET